MLSSLFWIFSIPLAMLPLSCSMVVWYRVSRSRFPSASGKTGLGTAPPRSPVPAPAARFCFRLSSTEFTSSPGKSSGFYKINGITPFNAFNNPAAVIPPTWEQVRRRLLQPRGELRHHAGGYSCSGTGIMISVGTRRSRRGTCLRGNTRSRRMGKEEFHRHDLRCERRTAVSRDLSLGQIPLHADYPDRARQMLRAPSRRAVPRAHAVGFAAKLAARVLCRTLSPERQVRNFA